MFRTRSPIRRLKAGLQIIRTGASRFTIIDPARERMIECGAQERYLLSLLATANSDDEILAQFEAKFHRPLSRRRYLEFVEQLASRGLLEGPAAQPETSPPPPVVPSPKPRRSVVNSIFDLLTLAFGWLVSPTLLLPIALLFGVAIAALVQKWSAFTSTLAHIWVTVPLVPLIALLFLKTLVFVSLPRELIVGLACRRHRGHIRSFGIEFHRGSIPAFRCDIGDTLAWMSEEGCWTVMLSGMACNVAIASLAILGWAMTPPSSSLGGFLAVLAPVHLVAFALHLNPLFPGDMCRIICYHWKDPRLRERASAESAAWLSGRYSPEPLLTSERFWLRLYGLGVRAGEALSYLVILGLGGLWLVTNHHLTGALLLIAALVIWFWEHLRSLVMSLLLFGGPWWIRWPVRMLLLAGIVALGFLPYSHQLVGECRLIPARQFGVRAQIDDEIVSLHVADGQFVEAGDLVATLSGRETRHKLDAAQAELARSQAQLDLLRAGTRPEDIEIAAANLAAAQVRFDYDEREFQRLDKLVKNDAASQSELDIAQRDRDVSRQELAAAKETLSIARQGPRAEEIRAAEAQVQKIREDIKYHELHLTMLELRAPIAGKVVTPHLEQRTGQWAGIGELICLIQDTENLLIEVSADAASVAHVVDGMPVNARLYGTYGELVTGHVDRIAAVAEEERDYRLQTVRSDRENLLDRSSNHAEADDSRVRVYAHLDYTQRPLQPGMTGYARIVIGPDVVWHAWWRPIQRFFLTEVWSWLP